MGLVKRGVTRVLVALNQNNYFRTLFNMNEIGIIGLGRLGLCLALNLEKVGFKVSGYDISEERVLQINNKSLRSSEPYVEEYLRTSQNLNCGTSINQLLSSTAEVIFIVVPTPSLPDYRFNHNAIDNIVNELQKHGKQQRQKHLIINSTVMPGYCDSIKEKVQALNYTLSYNPEFIAQGSIIRDQQYPDQILIGETDFNAGNKIEIIYKRLCKNQPRICRLSLISAEITKLATNCFLTTKIAFANAIGDIATLAGAEPHKILESIGADSRIGEKYFKYGFGYGGPCFPRDNKAFMQFAKESNYTMLLSEATDKANEQHAVFLTDSWKNKNSKEQEIIFDSVTYKRGTDILEESQQLKLAVSLAKLGYNIVVKESKEVVKQLQILYPNLFTYTINE